MTAEKQERKPRRTLTLADVVGELDARIEKHLVAVNDLRDRRVVVLAAAKKQSDAIAAQVAAAEQAAL